MPQPHRRLTARYGIPLLGICVARGVRILLEPPSETTPFSPIFHGGGSKLHLARMAVELRPASEATPPVRGVASAALGKAPESRNDYRIRQRRV
jgi:hypothetical protein